MQQIMWEKRFEELCDEMGVEVVLEAIAELENYCDRRMGAELEKLPKGTFEFGGFLRGRWNYYNRAIKIKVTITTGGPHIKIDFTGTCPQVRGTFELCSSDGFGLHLLCCSSSDRSHDSTEFWNISPL